MAKWLDDGRPCSIMFTCSECGKKAYFVHGKARGRNKEKRFCGYLYCPWCGAKMTIIPAEPTQINAPNTLDALTNADRIRAMTDEELARFLWQSAPYDNCPPIKCIEFETLKKPTTDECIACWGRWLRTEVPE